MKSIISVLYVLLNAMAFSDMMFRKKVMFSGQADNSLFAETLSCFCVCAKTYLGECTRVNAPRLVYCWFLCSLVNAPG